MRIAGGREFAIWDWGLVLGLTAVAILVSEVSGLRSEWEDAIVLTVAVFTVVITTLRPAWGRVVFWKNLALAFSVHAILVLMALQVLPERRFGIPKLLLTAVGVAETFLIGTVLWKKTATARSSGRRPK